MSLVEIRDKQQILSYCLQNKFLHIYSIGDLDDFFWPLTRWYAWLNPGIEALVLVYNAPDQPTVLALTDNISPMLKLLFSLSPLLPNNFYAHLSPGIDNYLEKKYNLEDQGLHLKMALADQAQIKNTDTSAAVSLEAEDLAEINALYSASYPGNWFDPRMLETGQYFGIFHNRKLVSIAGIHVYSPEYNVAALGNITTHPDYRGRGLGTKTTAACCRSLLKSVGNIGLNIKADNLSALTVYRNLGFTKTAAYHEFIVRQKSD